MEEARKSSLEPVAEIEAFEQAMQAIEDRRGRRDDD